jgi:hypothetical protein
MLSLILVMIIVANVFLWQFQMNQVDWEKMQEKVEILDVASLTPAWYYLGFDYRVQHNITGSSAGAQTNYQVSVTIKNGSGISDQSVYYTTNVNQPDFDDVRFTWYNSTSEHEQAIPYWREAAYNGENATFWVKVPEIPANPSSATIYVYYGNSTVASASDIASTLEATYTKINLQYEWTERTSTTSVATGDDVGSWQNIPFDFPFWMESKSRVYVCSNGFGIFDPTTQTNDWSNSLPKLMQSWMIAPFWDDLRTDRAGGIVSNPGAYVDNYTDHMVITWEATRYGASADSVKFQAILYRNGDVKFNIDNATNLANFTPTLGISKGDNTNYIDITSERNSQKSWLFTLRKYADPPPSHAAWGSEETYKTGTILKLKNAGPSTIHIVSIWVNNAALHKRYDADIFINSGDTLSYQRLDIALPEGNYIVKVVTERGNIAVYSRE